MSKSECEAVAFYKNIFSYYRIYKYRYDWDEGKRLIVEMRKEWLQNKRAPSSVPLSSSTQSVCRSCDILRHSAPSLLSHQQNRDVFHRGVVAVCARRSATVANVCVLVVLHGIS
jgi:hypothetical protein